jgi:hypothetical protein
MNTDSIAQETDNKQPSTQSSLQGSGWATAAAYHSIVERNTAHDLAVVGMGPPHTAIELEGALAHIFDEDSFSDESTPPLVLLSGREKL